VQGSSLFGFSVMIKFVKEALLSKRGA